MKDTKKQVNDEKLAGSVKEEAREAKQAVREAKSKVKEAKARAKEMKREAKEEAKKEAEAARDPNRKPSLPRRFLTWLLVPAPEKPLTERQKKLKKIADKFPLLIDFILCFILYFIVETMSRHSAIAAFSYLHTRTKVYLYNTFIIFLMTLPGFLMRRRKFWFTLIGALWLVLGAVNGVLLANRVTPFTGPDLKNIDDAIRVSNKYFPAWFTTVLVVAAVFGILCLIRYFFKSPKHKGKLHFWRNLAGFAAAIVAFVGLTQWMLDARQLSSYFSNIANSYLDYGYVYCLGVTVFNTGINEPNNYSEDLVNSVIAEEGNLPETADDVQKPNIIVVQLETFFDPTRVRWLKFNEDPVPNWHKLCKEYSSGLYTVPVVGAGTVNTEFETLTGMSLRFFGPGEYPYKESILRKNTCESLAYDLAELGYSTHAIHDNEANFYGRRKVYANLGFDTFTSGEYMDTQDDVNENGWMRDENLIKYITQALDSDENQDFIMTVSVQPHGSYPTEHVIEDPTITVSGTSTDGANAAWEYYVNQLHEEDQFVSDLIDTLNKRGEPTVVLFYGDHLPTMGLQDSDLNEGSIYETNYLIWDNIGLERQTGTIAAYQAAADLTNRLNIHTGTMFRFQQTMQGKEDYLYDMQVLQYDILYGNRYVYGGSNPFSKSVLSMGVEPVTISSIQKVSPDGSYYIYGDNFTQSCVFEVNGELQDTTFIDGNTLLVKGVTLSKGDWVNVAVQSNSSSKAIFSTSNTLVYGVGKLTDLTADGTDSSTSSASESDTSSSTETGATPAA
ncbi:MAG: LTA synthase family protein [Lachnospiraceae bacterium]|nr:LTA synthase family protein [Lachnospiraceae bacterium]MCH4063184.1 LTA synthase family protein [Lachnospiraceae bacterium]MCH4105007.1 LTA synthase family protein [Lachnospiraceae bacterium]MCI1308465.1 LTA synthase family protein [Lachnospiraceae bacterium]MCI1333137.1 LTA synthase family protein [Lachnospiraceae bacterium]